MSDLGSKEVVRVGRAGIYQTVSGTSTMVIFYWKLDNDTFIVGPFNNVNEAIKSCEAWLEYAATVPKYERSNIIHVNFRTKKRIS